MNKKEYKSPKITDLGDAKDIIQNLLSSGTGDTFPGTEDVLGTS